MAALLPWLACLFPHGGGRSTPVFPQLARCHPSLGRGRCSRTLCTPSVYGSDWEAENKVERNGKSKVNKVRAREETEQTPKQMEEKIPSYIVVERKEVKRKGRKKNIKAV